MKVMALEARIWVGRIGFIAPQAHRPLGMHWVIGPVTRAGRRVHAGLHAGRRARGGLNPLLHDLGVREANNESSVFTVDTCVY